MQECKELQKLKEKDVLNPGKKKEKKPMLFQAILLKP